MFYIPARCDHRNAGSTLWQIVTQHRHSCQASDRRPSLPQQYSPNTLLLTLPTQLALEKHVTDKNASTEHGERTQTADTDRAAQTWSYRLGGKMIVNLHVKSQQIQAEDTGAFLSSSVVRQ